MSRHSEDGLTNENEGIVELDEVEYPLRGWTMVRLSKTFVQENSRKVG